MNFVKRAWESLKSSPTQAVRIETDEKVIFCQVTDVEVEVTPITPRHRKSEFIMKADRIEIVDTE
jgi:hypothetical protein